MNNKTQKAQTSMMLIIIIIIIFAGIAIFLLSFAKTISQDEYMNMYVHNLLISILRTDTGYSDSNCKLVSDAIACSFATPGWFCGDSSLTCRDLAEDKVNEYLSPTFGLVKPNIKYLFIVEPGDWTSVGITRFLVGDLDLDTKDPDSVCFKTKKCKFANEPIQNKYNLNLGARLVIAQK